MADLNSNPILKGFTNAQTAATMANMSLISLMKLIARHNIPTIQSGEVLYVQISALENVTALEIRSQQEKKLLKKESDKQRRGTHEEMMIIARAFGRRNLPAYTDLVKRIRYIRTSLEDPINKKKLQNFLSRYKIKNVAQLIDKESLLDELFNKHKIPKADLVKTDSDLTFDLGFDESWVGDPLSMTESDDIFSVLGISDLETPSSVVTEARGPEIPPPESRSDSSSGDGTGAVSAVAAASDRAVEG